MRVELGRLHSKTQSTMIYVTHDQTDALTMGDSMVCMRNGRLEQKGKPSEIYARPVNEFVAGFVGMPPMNILDGFFRNGWLEVAGMSLVETRKLPVGAHEHVHVGIRPEHWDLSPHREHALMLTVILMEPLGADHLVYGECKGKIVIVRLSNEHILTPGEHLFIKPRLDKLHFFHPQTGVRIV
jgi:multiple sugar transport system ATP-binding protein